MPQYGSKPRAFLLYKLQDNLIKTVNLFDNLDVHRSLVDNAELVDIGHKEIKPVPTSRSEYACEIVYNHNFVIFKQ